MTDGRRVLVDVDGALRELREQLYGLEDRVSLSSERLIDLRQQESLIYRKLAELRADSIQTGSFQKDMDLAERKAAQLLVERKKAINDLNEKMQQSRNSLTELEQKRQRQADTVVGAAEAMQQQIDKAHEALKKDKQYQQQQSKTQKALDIFSAAEEKTRKAEQDHSTKGQPYKNDRLFSYLWERGYGTAKYKAGFIADFFDQMLARHIRFESARQNYYMLEEIPKRLREHSKTLKEKVDNEMAVLSSLETKAEADQGVSEMEARVTEGNQQLEVIDAAIENEETVYAAFVEERELFVAGKDTYFKQAIAVLIASFQADPIPELRREAEMTYGYEDDSLVSQLGQLRSRKISLDQSMSDNEQVHQRYKTRLHDLEEIRRRFKQYKYDASNSRFSDGQAIDVLLSEFVRGSISSDRVWAAIERGQKFIRYRNYPSRGGIGFPGGISFPGQISIPRGVRIPGGLGGVFGGMRGGGGGFRIPRGGGGGSMGGGFRTGGRF